MERASRIVSGETCSSFQEQFQKVAVLKNFRKFQRKKTVSERPFEEVL